MKAAIAQAKEKSDSTPTVVRQGPATRFVFPVDPTQRRHDLDLLKRVIDTLLTDKPENERHGLSNNPYGKANVLTHLLRDFHDVELIDYAIGRLFESGRDADEKLQSNIESVGLAQLGCSWACAESLIAGQVELGWAYGYSEILKLVPSRDPLPEEIHSIVNHYLAGNSYADSEEKVMLGLAHQSLEDNAYREVLERINERRRRSRSKSQDWPYVPKTRTT